MVSQEVTFGTLNDLVGHSLLLVGMAGCGKTHTLKDIVLQLNEDGKSVGYLDFRNELLDMVHDFNGVSLNSEEINEENFIFGFNHIHFNQDLVFTKNEYNLDFLPSLAKHIDYLIVDEAYLLLGTGKRMSDICKMMLKINPNLTFIFSVQSKNYFSTEDVNYLSTQCKHELLFRSTPAGLKKSDYFLCSFGRGEAVLFQEEKPLRYYSFYNPPTPQNLNYINEYITQK